MQHDLRTTEAAALLVFVRHPTPGLVKTRLAAGIGPEGAARFYRHCAEGVIAQAASVPGATVYVCYSLMEERQAVQHWLHPLQLKLQFLPQLPDPDLGARMAHAVAAAFASGHSKAVILGSDVPDLSAKVLEAALQALDQHQVIFGPAKDGGYYLIGTSIDPPQGLFQGIEWSTANVLELSLANAQRLGLRVAPLGHLPQLADIDTQADLQAWCQQKQQQEQTSLAAMAAQLLANLPG